MFSRVSAASVLLATISGCLGGGIDAVGEGDAEGWVAAGPDAPLILTLDLLGGSDWLVVEIRAEELNLIAVKVDAVFDFVNPAVSPELTGACPLLSVGLPDTNASFGVRPFAVPERLGGGLVEIGPQPEVFVRERDLSVGERVRTTGFRYTEGSQFITPIGSSKGHTYIAYGLPNHAAWMNQGGRYDLHVGEGDSFEYRIAYKGTGDCLIDFEHYPEGSFVRTSQGSRATDLGVPWQASEGLVAVIEYASDIQRSLLLMNPNGEVAVEDETYGNTLPESSVHETIYCGTQAGTWRLSFPVLEGTDHRAVYANTMLLDVPSEYHVAFPCRL